MLYSKLAALAALACGAAAQSSEDNNNGLLDQCRDICGNFNSAAQECENTTGDDAARLQCVCTKPRAEFFVPACEACVNFYQISGRNEYLGLRQILQNCNFQETSFTGASMTRTGPIVYTTEIVVTTSRLSMDSSMTGSMTASAQSQTTNAAGPAKTAAAGAAVGIGAIAMALL